MSTSVERRGPCLPVIQEIAIHDPVNRPQDKAAVASFEVQDGLDPYDIVSVGRWHAVDPSQCAIHVERLFGNETRAADRRMAMMMVREMRHLFEDVGQVESVCVY